MSSTSAHSVSGTPDLSGILQMEALQEVENLIFTKFASDAALLSEVSRYLLSLGGKRIRPVLTLVVAKMLGLKEPFRQSTAGQQLIDVAAGIELIHMATLLHDDIIDKSPMRRHRDSALKKYGVDSTLLTGDFLLVRAFGLCARLDRFIIDATEAACVALTEGEILEVPLHLQSHSIDTSLEISRKKTAALFKLACESAGHIVGAGKTAVTHLGNYGEKLGIAFQILDDILDVISDEDLLGKKTGQDLRERKPSVVNVLWLESGSESAKRLLTPQDADEEAFVAQALSELRNSPTIQKAKDLALTYTEEAERELELAVTSTRTAVIAQHQHQLTLLARYILERMK